MTREIKFRIVEMNTDGTITMHYDIMNNGAYGCFLISAINEPETYGVMQFTGLLDKNGKEIYEGDIITNFGVENDMKLRKYEVKFNEDGARFFLEYTKAKDSTSMDKWSMRDCEIIGNRFENPKLLTNAKI